MVILSWNVSISQIKIFWQKVTISESFWPVLQRGKKILPHTKNSYAFPNHFENCIFLLFRLERINCWGFRPALGADPGFNEAKAKTCAITEVTILTDVWKERVTQQERPYWHQCSCSSPIGIMYIYKYWDDRSYRALWNSEHAFFFFVRAQRMGFGLIFI